MYWVLAQVDSVHPEESGIAVLSSLIYVGMHSSFILVLLQVQSGAVFTIAKLNLPRTLA